MKVIIAGGSGTLGRALSEALTAAGHEVVVLTRSPRPERERGMVRDVRWDARTAGGWTAELAGGEVAIVNLAGRLVDARPTPATIADLTRSRVEATRALVTASRDLDRPLRRWVQASTTAIWSDAGEERLDESSPIPIGLPQMTGVAEQWERALDGAHSDHTAILRTGVVLEANTPALDRLLLLAELGLGGPVGTGRQWVSWIHVRDWVRIVLTALRLEGPELPAGVVVASAPHPVRNAELMRILRRAVGQRIGLPTPAPVLRLGALLLRTDPALGLTGRHATSSVLDRTGFRFEHPHLEGAVRDLLPPRPSR
ncbi:MAG: epimerase [Brachybacterium tyrofermentans]